MVGAIEEIEKGIAKGLRKLTTERERKKREQYRDFISKMEEVEGRTPQEMINIKDRTGYQFADSDISLCGKGQKFLSMAMRVDFIEKHEDFINFSRKLRLQVYFDNRTDKDSQRSNSSSEESGGEERLVVLTGPTPWEKQSEFDPRREKMEH